MQVLLNIPEKKSAFVMELLQNLTYVEIVPVVKEKPKQKSVKKRTEAEFLAGLRNAVQEVKDDEAGKIELRTLGEFLDELHSQAVS